MNTETTLTPTRPYTGTFNSLQEWIQTTATELGQLQSTVHLIVEGHHPAEDAGEHWPNAMRLVEQRLEDIQHLLEEVESSAKHTLLSTNKGAGRTAA